MSKGKIWENFINQYSVSKTLRFELKPVGKTLENINAKGLIEEDEQRAEDYKKAKKIIDEYHKYFIEGALGSCSLDLNILNEFLQLYNKAQKTDADKKEYEKIQTTLRKNIAESFGKNADKKTKEQYENLFKKELLRNDLPDWVEDEEDAKIIERFKTFTTYFTGFHENRKNIYDNEEKSTAIGYRIVHENLPKFIDNMNAFEKISKALDLSEIDRDFQSELGEIKAEEFFTIEFFNQCLNQFGIDRYNTLLGGISEGENIKKKQGLNERINLYNQQLKGERKKERLPKLKVLYKQILSDSSSHSFSIDEFENDNELLESLEIFYKNELIGFNHSGVDSNIFDLVKDLLLKIDESEQSSIYLKNDKGLTEISQRIFGDWNIIKSALEEYYDEHYPPKKDTFNKKELDERSRWLKENHSIGVIEKALANYENEIVREHLKQNSAPIVSYFKSLEVDGENLIDKIYSAYGNISDLLNSSYPDEKKLVSDRTSKDKIKVFLDSLMSLLHFLKPLDVKDLGNKDSAFYGDYDFIVEQLSKLVRLYNKTRNYLTRKPYSIEKIKLNFENSTLLAGWDVNKERDNNCVIFKRQDGDRELFYLGIMDKSHNKIFTKIEEAKSDDVYQKMNYKLLPGPNKMLPKVFFSKKSIDFYAPGEELLKNYKNGTHKKGENFNLQHCHELIDFFKRSINKHEDWSQFNFKFSDTSEYEDTSFFFKEVSQQGYSITFKNIDRETIEKFVDEGKLYLFQIYNKDFSPKSKGRPNLHTLYWKMLFDERNLANTVYQLNGEAEVFYRKKSISEKDRVVHRADEPIGLKNSENSAQKSLFPYDIVKDRRFTVDKFQFHVPITLNFKSEGNERLNISVNKFLKDNPDVNIIGLDRGERHLIYLTLINQKGEILHQESLNEVMGVNYQQKLHRVEKDRTEERRNWDRIENIKELKSGYLSQVVHKISQLMVEYNAIVVMEDLNFGFKRGRIKVEKQVYQKFEKTLIDKLNYLVFKDREPEEPAGVLNALQLTNKFESFKKLGKQCGFLFYVTSDYTSKIDPATGFVNLLYPKYESVEKSQNFFRKFDNICFNSGAGYFEFDFDYSNFTDRADGTRTRWKVCTVGNERFGYNPKTKASETVNVTESLKELLLQHEIAFENGESLVESISKNTTKYFHKSLLNFLRLTLTLRHSKTGTDIDYILSPVANEEGVFFDSRNASDKMPKDADANGAYNVALKGLMVLERINAAEDLSQFKFKDMSIKNKDWLKFVQDRQG